MDGERAFAIWGLKPAASSLPLNRVDEIRRKREWPRFPVSKDAVESWLLLAAALLTTALEFTLAFGVL